MKANQVLVHLLNKLGQRKGATVSQVALAWVLAQKPWIVPIPGTTKLKRLEENLRSIDFEFTPEEWRDLNHAVSKIKLKGDRYPADEEKKLGTENQFGLLSRGRPNTRVISRHLKSFEQ